MSGFLGLETKNAHFARHLNKRVRVRHVQAHMHVHYAQAHMHMRVLAHAHTHLMSRCPQAHTCVCLHPGSCLCARAGVHRQAHLPVHAHSGALLHHVHAQAHAQGVNNPAGGVFTRYLSEAQISTKTPPAWIIDHLFEGRPLKHPH